MKAVLISIQPGDTVYKVMIDGTILECVVLSIENNGTCIRVIDTYRKKNFLFSLDQMGKTLFADRKAAEPASAERYKLFWSK